MHDRDTIGHDERLLLVVRHVHERDPDRVLDALELDLELLAHLEVERAERLVEEEHLRLHHERTGERDALLLPARKLARLAPLELFEANEPESLASFVLAGGLAQAALLEAVGDVVQHVQMREERV